MNTKKRLIIINLFWFAVIAFLSYKMPFVTDDYLHSNSFATGEEISSVSMIMPSVMTYYNTWGGRALSMILIQSVLQLPRLVYALINPVIYVAIANVICLYARRANLVQGSDDTASPGTLAEADDILLAGVYLILWFFMPAIAEVVFWTTGTITYLWMNLVILAFAYIYYKDYIAVKSPAGADSAPGNNTAYAATKSLPGTIAASIGMLLFGFSAGLSNEAGACTLIYALFVYTVHMIRSGKQLLPDRIAGMVGVVIGAAVLILAPGNFVRTDAVVQHESIIMRYLFRLARESYYFLLLLAVPLLLCVCLMLIIRKRNTSEIFLALALISAYVMTFSAAFSTRILQMPLFLITIGIAISAADLRNALDTKVAVAVRVFIVGLMFVVLIEIATSLIVAPGKNSFFDRHMDYYYSLEELVGGIIPDE